MSRSHQTFKQCVSLSRVKSLARNNFRASITGRKWACESLQIHQQVRRSYWDTKAETSSPKPKRWIFGPLFGSGDFRGANLTSGVTARRKHNRCNVMPLLGIRDKWHLQEANLYDVAKPKEAINKAVLGDLTITTCATHIRPQNRHNPLSEVLLLALCFEILPLFSSDSESLS